jgi:hypothetical protein
VWVLEKCRAQFCIAAVRVDTDRGLQTTRALGFKINRFKGEDITVAHRRRQTFVAAP